MSDMARSTILIFLGLVALSAAQDCTWAINLDLPTYQPLYIDPTSTSYDIRGFWLPQVGDVVTVPNGQSVLFSCTNGFLVALNREDATLECVGDKTWRDPTTQNTYSFSELGCNRDAYHIARYTGNSCPITYPGDLREVEMGFLVAANGQFYKILESCLRYDTSDSIYAKFRQVPENRGHQSGFPRPSFTQGVGFYPTGMSVDTLYTQVSQTDAVALSVGSKQLAEDYIQPGTDFYMSRGHLCAKADFLYGSHQRASFWFMNVAPQFQTFNGGNWQTLEFDFQNFAEVHPNDLDIYTGTHEINQLLDIDNIYVDISLEFDPPLTPPPAGQSILRSPRLFWKVVHDRVTLNGVAFLGINNPYETRVAQLLDSMCPNVCDQLNYLTWDPTDQVKGYAICCEVPAFLNSVPEMPTITVNGLLTGH